MIPPTPLGEYGALYIRYFLVVSGEGDLQERHLDPRVRLGELQERVGRVRQTNQGRVGHTGSAELSNQIYPEW